jgi:hypothetical protein
MYGFTVEGYCFAKQHYCLVCVVEKQRIYFAVRTELSELYYLEKFSGSSLTVALPFVVSIPLPHLQNSRYCSGTFRVVKMFCQFQ